MAKIKRIKAPPGQFKRIDQDTYLPSSIFGGGHDNFVNNLERAADLDHYVLIMHRGPHKRILSWQLSPNDITAGLKPQDALLPAETFEQLETGLGPLQGYEDLRDDLS